MSYKSQFSGQQIDNSISYFYTKGALFFQTSSIEPAELFGGIWEQIAGRTLIGAGDYSGVAEDGRLENATYIVGNKGGEIKHKDTVAELPTHEHKEITSNNYFQEVYSASGTYAFPTQNGVAPTYGMSNYLSGIRSTGSSQPHNNMSPYLVVYIWERIE